MSTGGISHQHIYPCGYFKLSNYNWQESLYAEVLLSQIGEFSFVFAAVAFQASIIND